MSILLFEILINNPIQERKTILRIYISSLLYLLQVNAFPAEYQSHNFFRYSKSFTLVEF